jgi:hypothetical protein
MCTLLKALHGLYYEKETLYPEKLGASIYQLATQLLPKVNQDLQETGLPCAHVLYQELTKQPVETAKKVYSHYYWNFSSEYEKIMQEYLIENTKRRAEIAKKNGKSKTEPLNLYHPKEYGLTKEQLSEGIYAEYAERYQITSTS